MKSWVWPAVVTFLGCMASVVAILIFVPQAQQSAGIAVMAILSMVASAVGTLVSVARIGSVHDEVTEVKKQVNGRMSDLVAKIPDSS